jgi:hypothetical protein
MGLSATVRFSLEQFSEVFQIRDPAGCLGQFQSQLHFAKSGLSFCTNT